jgi:hypothetical protein
MTVTSIAASPAGGRHGVNSQGWGQFRDKHAVIHRPRPFAQVVIGESDRKPAPGPQACTVAKPLINQAKMEFSTVEHAHYQLPPGLKTDLEEQVDRRLASPARRPARDHLETRPAPRRECPANAGLVQAAGSPVHAPGARLHRAAATGENARKSACGPAVKQQAWGQFQDKHRVIHRRGARSKVVVGESDCNPGFRPQTFAPAKPLINQAKIGFSTARDAHYQLPPG